MENEELQFSYCDNHGFEDRKPHVSEFWGFLSGRFHESYGNAPLTIAEVVYPGNGSMIFIILRASRRVRYCHRQAHRLMVGRILRDKIHAALRYIFRRSQFLKRATLRIQCADSQRLLHPHPSAPTVLHLPLAMHELI
jgi:hypothetical protein